MVKSKKATILNFKPTQKNKIYLERLGILDGRTGNVRKATNTSLGSFLNECISLVCESQMRIGGLVASNDELRDAWIKFQVSIENKKIKEATENIEMLARMKSQERRLQKSLEVIN